jgi:hypothetical protein
MQEKVNFEISVKQGEVWYARKVIFENSGRKGKLGMQEKRIFEQKAKFGFKRCKQTRSLKVK